MDQNFFDNLESQISDIGSQEVWKKKIGDKTLWISPVSNSGQEKVQSVLTTGEADITNLYEAKRVTLSKAIVGIDDIDLRPFKKSGPIFKVFDARVNREVKVDLSAYLLNKISDWSSEFVDIAFDVFVDLMESYSKYLVKDIKFENAKDPREELAELEDKASILRESLGLPPKIEVSATNSDDAIQEPESVPTEKNSEIEEEPEDFDPFKTIKPNDSEFPSEKTEVQIKSPELTTNTLPIPTPNPNPIHTFNDQILNKNLNRTPNIPSKESSPDSPIPATPSVPDEIIESKFKKEKFIPPVINPTNQNVNPRFQRNPSR